MKRILTIQDISCFGRCSTTIALPVLSAMGIETTVLPTAILSTHTMFKDYIKRDLTDTILSFAKQWKDNGVSFDAIYTGYLGTAKDIELVMNVIDLFRNKNTLLFVDPVFGDHGRTYAGISEDYAAHCAQLCGKADYAVPNITEACLMTGTEYKEEYDEEPTKGKDTELLIDPDKPEEIYEVEAAAGALVCGKEPENAFMIAADYTAETIRVTKEDSDDPRFGIHFESTIPDLIRIMGNNL